MTPDRDDRRHPALFHLSRWLARFHWPDLAAELAADQAREEGGDSRLPRQTVEDFALVLSARGIPHRLRHAGTHARLLVPPDRFLEARREIETYQRENAPGPRDAPRPAPAYDNTKTTLWVLIAVGALFSLTAANLYPGGERLDWLGLGGGDTKAILSGQWWRAVTALTLHADVAHMAANLTLGGVFLVTLAREIRCGPAFALTLAAGAAGNVIKALVQGPGHLFIGASTAVFAAVGLLGAIRAVSGHGALNLRRLAPAAAALMFLAFLGAGSEEIKNIDLAGHLCGFAAGCAIGLAQGLLLKRFGPPGKTASALMGSIAAMAVIFSWAAALGQARIHW